MHGIRSDIAGMAVELRERFLGAQPFPHLVFDGFLDPDLYQRLCREFPAAATETTGGDYGNRGRKFTRTDLPEIGPACREFDALIRSPGFLSLLGKITGIEGLLYDPEYLGGGTHENLEGQELDPHIDFNYHPKTQRHRRLNLICFLNEEWRDDWGGLIEFHTNPWDPETNRIESVLPAANRAVLFETSELSWHGFERIRLPGDKKHISRRSIAVYFYTTNRPAEQIATEHSTVYVQRPLPGHIRPGHTLTEEDHLALRTMMARRDQQIRYLYGREAELLSIVSRVIHWPVVRAWSRIKRLLGVGTRPS